MNQNFRQNWISRALLQSIGVVILGVLALCLVVSLLFVLATSPAAPRDRNTLSLYAGLIPLLLVAVGIAFVLVWSGYQIARRRRLLDEVFLPLGLEGKSYFQNGRQYRGSFSGRQVNVYLSRGPLLEFYLESPIKTRLSVAPADALIRWIAKRANERALSIDDPAFSNLVVYAADEDWSRQLLSDAETKAAFLRLANRTLSRSPQIIFHPDALALRLYGIHLDQLAPSLARQALADLLLIARQAETLPPPAHPLESSAWEKKTRTNRTAFLLPSLGLIVVILLAILAFVMGCIYLPFLLQK